MIKSLFAHEIDRIELIQTRNHVDISLHANETTFPVSELTVFRNSLASDNPPDILYRGVDVPALLEAARAALRALEEEHEGNPIALPLGVTEARACLLSVLNPQA